MCVHPGLLGHKPANHNVQTFFATCLLVISYSCRRRWKLGREAEQALLVFDASDGKGQLLLSVSYNQVALGMREHWSSERVASHTV